MFTLDGFDFWIDKGTSRLVLEQSPLTLEVSADEPIVERLSEDESHPWHWLLYAPTFYARELSVTPDASGGFVRSVTRQDDDTCEIALYALEHLTVLPCTISLEGTVVRIEGVVERGLLDDDRLGLSSLLDGWQRRDRDILHINGRA